MITTDIISDPIAGASSVNKSRFGFVSSATSKATCEVGTLPLQTPAPQREKQTVSEAWESWRIHPLILWVYHEVYVGNASMVHNVIIINYVKNWNKNLVHNGFQGDQICTSPFSIHRGSKKCLWSSLSFSPSLQLLSHPSASRSSSTFGRWILASNEIRWKLWKCWTAFTTIPDVERERERPSIHLGPVPSIAVLPTSNERCRWRIPYYVVSTRLKFEAFPVWANLPLTQICSATWGARRICKTRICTGGLCKKATRHALIILNLYQYTNSDSIISYHFRVHNTFICGS